MSSSLPPLGFSRQEYWRGTFELMSPAAPALQVDSLALSHQRSPRYRVKHFELFRSLSPIPLLSQALDSGKMSLSCSVGRRPYYSWRHLNVGGSSAFLSSSQWAKQQTHCSLLCILCFFLFAAAIKSYYLVTFYCLVYSFQLPCELYISPFTDEETEIYGTQMTFLKPH